MDKIPIWVCALMTIVFLLLQIGVLYSFAITVLSRNTPNPYFYLLRIIPFVISHYFFTILLIKKVTEKYKMD